MFSCALEHILRAGPQKGAQQPTQGFNRHTRLALIFSHRRRLTGSYSPSAPEGGHIEW